MSCPVLISKHDNKLSPLIVLTLLHRKKLFVPYATYTHMNFLEFFFQAWLSLLSSFFPLKLKETNGYEEGASQVFEYRNTSRSTSSHPPFKNLLKAQFPYNSYGSKT